MAPALSITPKQFLKRAEKCLKRFAELLDEISKRSDPKTIHDIRVASRRLQQVFAVVFPKPRSEKQRRLIRLLRKVRRRLGGCRSLDVSLELVAQRTADASPPADPQWEEFRAHLEEERKRIYNRARRKLSKHAASEFLAIGRRCLDRIAPELRSSDLHGALQESTERARRDWQDAFASAKQGDPERLHALRIAGKRLRYRVELLAAFGEAQGKEWVESLKEFQHGFGQWHDRHVLLQLIAEFVGEPDLLLNRTETARRFLDEIERERDQEAQAVESLMRRAEKLAEALEPMPASSEAETAVRPLELLSHRRFVGRPA